jgi:hypothetical protein
MNRNARAVYCILVILISAVYLPRLYDKIFRPVRTIPS